MTDIRPGEVSKILKEQLGEKKTYSEFEEVGTVLQVGDGIARIYGLSHVEYNELIEFDSGLMGIALNLEADNVGAVLLESSEKVVEVERVKRTRRIASLRVGEGL